MNILSQRDPRWKDKKIGKSNSTIGNYGCTITCLSMQAGINPDEFNDRMTAVDGFQGDLILWQKINQAVPWLKFPDMGRHYSYDDKLVKEAIEKYGSCLVEVDFDGVTSTPNDRHWVLFKGDKKANDPWTGTEISTSKYPILKGFTIIEVSKKPEENNMTLTDDQKRILQFLTEQGANEGKVREAFGALADLEKCKKENDSLRKLSDSLSSSVAELTESLAKEQKLNTQYQKEQTTAKESLETIQEQLALVTKEKNDYQKWYQSAKKELKELDNMTAIQHIIYGVKNLFVKK